MCFGKNTKSMRNIRAKVFLLARHRMSSEAFRRNKLTEFTVATLSYSLSCVTDRETLVLGARALHCVRAHSNTNKSGVISSESAAWSALSSAFGA